MKIHRLHGLSGAEAAVGPTAVIDTFRAFTTAAFAHAAGVGTHILVATLDDARSLRETHPSALLCGEDRGVAPDDFDLGNSPAEVLEADLEGRTLIQRTSAGTRCVLAALRAAQVTIVHPTSLVIASATATALQSATEVSLVASGRFGIERATEDDLTADFISATLGGKTRPGATGEAARESDSAARLANSGWAHPDDVELCCDVDRFDFYLTAISHPDGHATVHRNLP
jgi:2-phosphosulfolactate phosphatase